MKSYIGCASKKLTSKRLQAQLPAKYEEEVVKSYRNNLVSALPRYHEGTARRVCRNQNGKGDISLRVFSFVDFFARLQFVCSPINTYVADSDSSFRAILRSENGFDIMIAI